MQPVSMTKMHYKTDSGGVEQCESLPDPGMSAPTCNACCLVIVIVVLLPAIAQQSELQKILHPPRKASCMIIMGISHSYTLL